MRRPEDSDDEGIAPSAPLSQNLEDYPLSKATVKNLRDKGFPTLFPIQTACFAPIFAGKDLVGRDRTGSGKTLAFALPVLERMREQGAFKKVWGQHPLKIVIVPTRELAIQVTNEYKKFKNYEDEYRVLTCYGGSEMGLQIDTLRRGTDIVVGTPGRLIDLLQRGALMLDKIQVFVLDETDQMLNIGFQDDIENILKFAQEGRPKTSKIQYLLFSATIPKWVEKVAKSFMSGDVVRIDMIKGREVKTSTTVEHLAILFKTREDKVAAVGDVVQVHGGQHCRTIIFTDKKEEGNEVLLKGNLKIECQILNGDIPQKQREVTFQSFKEGKVKCLIATNLASRGLDFPEVDLIVQLSPPVEIDTYIHRSGRTGRAGKSGKCITFFLKKQQEILDKIEGRANIKIKKIGAPQADDIIKSNARDVLNSLSQVSPDVLTHFEDNVDLILQEYTPKEALARALAIISGYTQEIKNRSLLGGAEGCVTFLLETQQEIDKTGVYWGILKKYCDAGIIDSIKSLQILENKKGCAFDVEEKYEAILDEIGQSLQRPDLKLYQPKELPSLLERPMPSFQSSSNYAQPPTLTLTRPGFNVQRSERTFNSNQDRNFNTYEQRNFQNQDFRAQNQREERVYNVREEKPAVRKDLKKIFVANLNGDVKEADLNDMIQKKGCKAQEIILLRNQDQTLKGFGYMKFADEKEASIVLKELQGARFSGRPIRLEYADIKESQGN